jgi:four helix bundle protein
MFSYQKLEVYKKAFLLNQSVYRFLKEKTAIPAYAKNQLGRASLSIVLNIAEGSAKFTNRDRRNFFVVARGSVFESAAMVEILHAENEIPLELKTQLAEGLDEISRILYAMIKNLEQ